MIKTQSSCRQHTKSRWRFYLVIFAALLSLSVVVSWIYSVRHTDLIVALLGAGYALLCTAFLAAQIIAFIKFHMDYDQSIEQPKYELLHLEEKEWVS